MISVDGLTKKFGSTVAVDGICFEIPQGQLVGFLGPNGAGKTTTLRLLTGYLPLDGGQAKLMGLDLENHSLEIRRRLGFLPENNPLPDDIEVTEYLHFVGRLRGIKNNNDRFNAVKKVLRQCSIQSEIGKKLGELSKGYRQRVGLAQAIIHDPDVLILDEPTSGLDPNQVREVWHLIQSLKQSKTILLSTHILPEVEKVCDRILIINNGRIVADDSPALLSQKMQLHKRYIVSLEGKNDDVEKVLSGLQGVKKIKRNHSASGTEEDYLLETEPSADLRKELFTLANKNQWPILGIRQEHLPLEEIFQLLTETQVEPTHAQNN